MEYAALLIIIVVVLFIKMIYDNKTSEKKRLEKITKSWGCVPDEEYTSEKLESIQAFYLHYKDETLDIDDITWNDVDMDNIFMLINNTSSAIGEEYLYSLLKKPKYENESLEERERLINFFHKNKEPRIQMQLALSLMGKLKSVSIYEYINRTDDIQTSSSGEHYFASISLIASIFITIFSPFLNIPVVIGVLAIIFCAGNNIVHYYQQKAKIEKYFSVFSYILRLLYSVKKINGLQIKEISEYTKNLKDAEKAFKKFKKGSTWVLSGRDMSGSLQDILMDYIRILFHVDLIKFNNMLIEVRKNKKVLNDIYYNIGILDSAIAIASFRTWLNGQYCLPILKKSKVPFIKIKEIFHPLISEPIPNSIEENQCVLVTGSNASGKSTFIKTVAINTILSQTIHTSLCTQYEASFFKVYSSMALQDNLQEKESYYIVEIKSLKRILDQLSTDIPTLCFVDEVLRGTNTLERIAASTEILYSLSSGNALCFAATHDIELTYILEKYYSNYHFQEQIKDNEILFDYLLHEGRAVSRNAIKLLSIMGYQKDIIKKATNAANTFLETGVWKNLN